MKFRTLEDLSRSSRSLSILLEEKLGEIEEMITNNPQLSIHQSATRADISRSSYQVGIKQLHFKLDSPTLTFDLNDDAFNRRTEFCELWIEKFDNDPNLIDSILWSDEAKFNRNTTVIRYNSIYWDRENSHLKFEVPNTQEIRKILTSA